MMSQSLQQELRLKMLVSPVMKRKQSPPVWAEGETEEEEEEEDYN